MKCTTFILIHKLNLSGSREEICIKNWSADHLTTFITFIILRLFQSDWVLSCLDPPVFLMCFLISPIYQLIMIFKRVINHFPRLCDAVFCRVQKIASSISLLVFRSVTLVEHYWILPTLLGANWGVDMFLVYFVFHSI